MEQYKSSFLYLISFVVILTEIGMINTYFIYAIVAICGLCNLKVSHDYDSIITAFILLTITSYIRIWQYNERMLYDITLTFIGFLPFINTKRVSVNIRLINLMAIFIYVIIFYPKIGVLTISVLYNAIFDSNLETESYMLAFIFPFFTLYWFSKKKWTWFSINLFFVIVSGKRISALGVLIPMIVVCLINLASQKKKQKILIYFPYLAVILNGLYLFISFMIVSGLFDDFLFEYTGLSTNAFTMGRQMLYLSAFNAFDVNNVGDLLFGESAFYELLANGRFHNDILVLFIENGIIIFCLFWYKYYKKCNLNTLPYLICLNVLFMTDNTLIYVPVLFFACLFVRLARYENKYEKHT